MRIFCCYCVFLYMQLNKVSRNSNYSCRFPCLYIVSGNLHCTGKWKNAVGVENQDEIKPFPFPLVYFKKT